jgi:hypothetical protein
MVSMLDELNEHNILKLIFIVRFACAALDMRHPIRAELRPNLPRRERNQKIENMGHHIGSYSDRLRCSFVPHYRDAQPRDRSDKSNSSSAHEKFERFAVIKSYHICKGQTSFSFQKTTTPPQKRFSMTLRKSNISAFSMRTIK